RVSQRAGQRTAAGIEPPFGDIPRHCRQWSGASTPGQSPMTTLIGLHLTGRRVLIAGGGGVATRRVRRFMTEGADVVVVAPEASAELQRHASHGDLTWVARPVVEEDLAG